VIVNGYRERDPDQREAEVSEPLQRACENYRFGLVTARALFELVRRALGGADEAALLGMRRRLLQGSGLLAAERLLGLEDEEAPEAGPIF
jgi:hypothetical protein